VTKGSGFTHTLFYSRYIASLRSTPILIIPLPDKDAPPGSAAHISAYQEFATGATVMALYPDTSCFYRAEVIASPRDIPTQGRVSVDRLRKHCRTALTRDRIPGRHTTNSNLKTTMIKNTWYQRQRSSNGRGNDVLDLFWYGPSAVTYFHSCLYWCFYNQIRANTWSAFAVSFIIVIASSRKPLSSYDSSTGTSPNSSHS
jgi:SGF29 tudor-like domain